MARIDGHVVMVVVQWMILYLLLPCVIYCCYQPDECCVVPSAFDSNISSQPLLMPFCWSSVKPYHLTCTLHYGIFMWLWMILFIPFVALCLLLLLAGRMLCCPFCLRQLHLVTTIANAFFWSSVKPYHLTCTLHYEISSCLSCYILNQLSMRVCV